jgi:hypothetical protein
MHPLVRFAQIAAASTFSIGEIHPYVIAALGFAPNRYSLAALRYDLSKLRAKAPSRSYLARAATAHPPRVTPSA